MWMTVLPCQVDRHSTRCFVRVWSAMGVLMPCSPAVAVPPAVTGPPGRCRLCAVPSWWRCVALLRCDSNRHVGAVDRVRPAGGRREPQSFSCLVWVANAVRGAL